MPPRGSVFMSSPASLLLGVKLDKGWIVTERRKKLPHQTGHYFSECYIVVNENGRKAFLKALDYSRAMSSPDPAAVLNALTEGFLFERNVLNRCRGMDRVVTG